MEINSALLSFKLSSAQIFSIINWMF